MNCKKVKEEFLFVFGQDEDGQQLRIAIHHHVSECPDCAEKAAHTRRIVTLVRERCRCEAPQDLRTRILQVLQKRARG